MKKNLNKILKQVQNDKIEESGRSMVEMLGVLAVIGVLSVAGIAGYTRAMNRHKANELLNEVSKRATIVAMQRTTGNARLSVDEFGTAPVIGSTLGVMPVGSKQFAITISKMDKDVCENVLNSIGSNTQARYLALKNFPVKKIDTCRDDDSEYALVFNNDLNNIDTYIYDENIGAAPCSSSSDCTSIGQTCSDGKCINTCDTGSYLTSTESCIPVLGTNPSCTSENNCKAASLGCCVSGKCAGFEYDYLNAVKYCPSENKECSSNMDCDTPNEYCSITGKSCDTPSTGTCLPVNATEISWTIDNNPVTLLQSENAVSSRWAAENWCKAQGKRLIEIKDLGITSNHSCQGSSCGADWTTLNNTFKTGWLWTTSRQTTSNSCATWIVHTYESLITTYPAHSPGGYVLCR